MKKIEKLLRSKNSSITRVRPILLELLKREDDGAKRLHELLEISPGFKNLPAQIRNNPGIIISDCRRRKMVTDKNVISMKVPSAFEWEAPPPGEFLRWMIEHPEELTKPKNATTSEATTKLRASLLDRESPKHDETRNQALANLNSFGAIGSRKKWWAFEGFTYVDCLIETDSLVLFIEGKRTEDSSQKVSWYSKRNQIARNLECARQHALSGKKAKAFAVLMVIEEGTMEKHEGHVHPDKLRESWPHYREANAVQDELIQGFLGIVTWQQVMNVWKLDQDHYSPDTVSEAMDRFFTQN